MAESNNCSFVVQTDTDSKHTWVDSNGGFYFVRANSNTLQAFQLLQQFLFVNPDIEDQQALGIFPISFFYNSLCLFVCYNL
jgi:hypothetical protein